MPSPRDVWVLDPANLTPYYCLTLCEALAKRGDRVRFVTSPFRYDSRIAVPPGVEVKNHYFRHGNWLQRHAGNFVRRGIQFLSYPLDHRSLLREIRREKPDVLHVQWSRLPFFDQRLLAAVKAEGVAIVHTVHDVEPLFKGAVSKLEQVYALADALIVHTQVNADELVSRYPTLDPKRIHIIPHGPLQGDSIPADATQHKARELLGIPQGVPVALHFGGIRPYKGLDILLSAFLDVAKRLPAAVLVLAGRPNQKSDEPDLDGLKRAGVNVVANLGFIPNDEVWRYYLAADVTVLPYRRITQSGVLLSCMAHGRASVVTAVGGLPEVVTADTGWVVPPENPAALADAIVAALEDRPRTLLMGEKAREQVNTRFSWTDIAERTHDLYNCLIKSPK